MKHDSDGEYEMNMDVRGRLPLGSGTSAGNREIELIAFDIEVLNWAEPMVYEDLEISCAAICFRRPDGGLTYKVWQGAEGMAMTREKVDEMVYSLWRMTGQIVTVVGAGFDFRVVASNSSMPRRAREMALNHVDLCFIVQATRGFRLGLDAIAKGAGVQSKLKSVKLKDGSVLEDMDGSKAPELWLAGESDAVIAYLKDDVRATLEAAEVVLEKKQIRWVAKSGRPNTVFVKLIDGELPTVVECLNIRVPDTSWMTDPPTRKEVIEWANDFRSE